MKTFAETEVRHDIQMNVCADQAIIQLQHQQTRRLNASYLSTCARQRNGRLCFHGQRFPEMIIGQFC